MSSLDLRKLPESPAAEEAIISSIFIDGVSSLSECMNGRILEESFATLENRLIYRTLLWLHKNNKPVTMDVLVEELQRTKKIEEVGGIPYISQISQRIPTTAELRHFIELVRELYVKRELIRYARAAVEMAYEEDIDIEKYTVGISELLSIRYSTQNNKTLLMATEEAILTATRFAENRPEAQDIGLDWPWADFNKRFGEAMPGQLIVVAARPGGGKSSLLRQAVDHWGSYYGNTCLFSREMMIGQMPFLFAQMRSGISWKGVRKMSDGRTSHSDAALFIETLRDFKKQKAIHIFDRDKSMSQVAARIKSFGLLKNIRAAGVDYLQRYEIEQGKGETRDLAIGKATMQLKDLAMDLGIPIVLLCQINRSAEREKRPLQLSDLRESGNIEQDADRVIFLEVPPVDPLTNVPQNPEDEDTTQLYVTARQAKGRDDGRASCGLYFKLATTTLRSAMPS